MAPKSFRAHIANLFRARFPFLYISSWEEERVLNELKYICNQTELIKTKRELLYWSQTKGFINENNEVIQDSKTPMKALEFIEKYDKPAVFVLCDFHYYLGFENRTSDMLLIRKIRDLVNIIEKSVNPKNTVFLSPSLVIPEDLQKDINIVEFGLPTFEEIKGVLCKIVEANSKNKRIKIDLTSEDVERLAKAAIGLTLQEAENAFALSMVSRGKLDIESLEDVHQEKQQTIRKSGILEFVNNEPNIEDVGGLDNIKRWLKKRNKSWLDSAQEYGLPAPKGILITGVPGCGKSLIAKAISSMWHLPLLRLDMGKIFSGIVGSSEQNMRNAIAMAEAISPSILWIDEIEKGFAGTGSTGDSGTSSRIFGTFLTWMQEKTKPVFVIATANNISLLPPELMRKGRFDEIFFVDLPTRIERVEIFRIHLQKRLKQPKALGNFVINDTTLAHLADQTEAFIGAEIEQTVISALFEAFSEDRGLRLDDLNKVISQTVPLSVTQSEQIRALRNWANIRAVAATSQEAREEYRKDELSSTQEQAEHVEDIRSKRGGRAVDF